MQSEQNAAKGRFSASALADYAERLAPFDGKRHIIHCMKVAGGNVKIFFKWVTVSKLSNVFPSYYSKSSQHLYWWVSPFIAGLCSRQRSWQYLHLGWK